LREVLLVLFVEKVENRKIFLAPLKLKKDSYLSFNSPIGGHPYFLTASRSEGQIQIQIQIQNSKFKIRISNSNSKFKFKFQAVHDIIIFLNRKIFLAPLKLKKDSYLSFNSPIGGHPYFLTPSRSEEAPFWRSPGANIFFLLRPFGISYNMKNINNKKESGKREGAGIFN